MHDLLFSCNLENYGMFNRQLARAIGLFPAIILQELIAHRRMHINHLINHKKHGPGWFWCTVDHVAMETGMDELEQKKALRKLKKLGLIEFLVFGMPTKRHFRIDVSKVIDVLKLSENDGYSKPQQEQENLDDGFYEDHGCVKQNDEIVFYGMEPEKQNKIYINQIKNMPTLTSEEILQREIGVFSRDDSNKVASNRQNTPFLETKSTSKVNSQRERSMVSRDDSKLVSSGKKQGFNEVSENEGPIRSHHHTQCHNYTITKYIDSVNEKEIVDTIRTEAIASSLSFSFGSSSFFQARPKENPFINLELQKPMSQQKDSQVPKPKAQSLECKAYGSLENVLLTDAQHLKLLEKMSVVERDYLIESLSLYGAQMGEKVYKKYKCHYATILNWQRRDIKSKVGADGKDWSKIAPHRRGSKMVTSGDFDECTYQPREFGT